MENGERPSTSTRAPPSRSATAAASAVRDLRDSPRLVLHMRRFEELLEDESRRRETFQNEAPVDQKAEFINGEIVVSDPVSDAHDRVKNRLHTLLRSYLQLLSAYELGTAGTVRGERMLVSLTRNDYEPDLCFFGQEKTRDLTPEQWALPAPDLIVEVLSPSSEERARGVKFDDYAAHGIGEYWIIDPRLEVVEQYVLDDASEKTPEEAQTQTEARSSSAPDAPALEEAGQYVLQAKVKEESLESHVVDGFRPPAEALFDDRASLEALRASVV